QETLTLNPSADGYLEKTIEADQPGVYIFEDGQGQKRLVIVGNPSPPELKGVRSTPDILAPIVRRSGGGIVWLAATPEPGIRFISGQNGTMAGDNWIALRKNNDFTVTGLRETPLLPPGVPAALLLGLMILCWWREGRPE